MFELNLEILSTVIIVLAIIIKEKILSKLNLKGFFPNLIYFLLVIAIVFPLNYFRPSLIFSELDKTTAKDLIKQVINNPVFKDFNSIKNVKVKPYWVDENLYNVKADIKRKELSYKIYLQPTCENNECSVTYNKAVIVPVNIDIPIKDVGIEFFEKRPCNDYLAEEILRGSVKKVFSSHFDIFEKKGIQYTKEIKSVDFYNIVETKKKTSKLEGSRYLNSCSSSYEINAVLTQNENSFEELNKVLNILYDSYEKNGDTYKIKSIIDYDIYVDNNKNVKVRGLPRKIRNELEKSEKNKKSIRSEKIKMEEQTKSNSKPTKTIKKEPNTTLCIKETFYEALDDKEKIEKKYESISYDKNLVNLIERVKNKLNESNYKRELDEMKTIKDTVKSKIERLSKLDGLVKKNMGVWGNLRRVCEGEQSEYAKNSMRDLSKVMKDTNYKKEGLEKEYRMVEELIKKAKTFQ